MPLYVSTAPKPRSYDTFLDILASTLCYSSVEQSANTTDTIKIIPSEISTMPLLLKNYVISHFSLECQISGEEWIE